MEKWELVIRPACVERAGAQLLAVGKETPGALTAFARRMRHLTGYIVDRI